MNHGLAATNNRNSEPGKKENSMKAKMYGLVAMTLSGAALFNGCLGSVWDGFWNSGWPTDNRWLNIGIDVLKEELFG